MAERKVRITVGDVELEALWGDSHSADLIYEALPLNGHGSYWGGELYFEIPIETQAESGSSDVVEPGAVAFWPPGNCLCLFWGATPASHDSECRAASPVNVVGHIQQVEKLKGISAIDVAVEAI